INLRFKSKYVKIEDKANLNAKISSGLLNEYINAKNFVESHDFKQLVKNAINDANLKSSCSLTKPYIPSDEEVFADSSCNGKTFSEAERLIEGKIKEKLGTLNIRDVITASKITPSCSHSKTDSEYTKTCDFNFDAGFNALVKLTSSSKYPLENGVKIFEFKFRILIGTKMFPNLGLFNSCQENL
ncbi:MAG: hypothetical protein ACP5O8_02050, partial [Candidatus Aenigmatarchaeota archaeon]